MKLKEIIEFIDKNIPKNLALENDEIGFKKEYNLNQDISSIKIFMDLYPEFDTQKTNTLNAAALFDTNYAKETSNFSKQNILSQIGAFGQVQANNINQQMVSRLLG